MATLTCFRGEEKAWWGTPELRLVHGLSVREAWKGARPEKFDIMSVWKALKQDMKEKGPNAAAYAQTLRQSGRVYALAFGRDKKGAYDHKDNVYKLEIANARTFLWTKGDDPQIGEEVDWAEDYGKVKSDYVVLNAATLEESTVLGFGHLTGTQEVTFFTDLPTAWVAEVNGNKTSSIKVVKNPDMDQKIAIGKFRK